MITEECINCGACEPECPNNAITQAEEIYVIDPVLCTECVGFHDFEACAAVCPVDCCVTDPNNLESEELLIARARTIHQDVDFPENFESRFRKGAGTPAETQQPKSPVGATSNASTESSTGSSTSSSPPASTKAPQSIPEQEATLPLLTFPDIDGWEIPIHCFKCGQTHAAPAKHFMIGNVLFCPHCQKSIVIKDNLNFQIRSELKESYEKWERKIAEFQAEREKDRREFQEKREREFKKFVMHQQQELDKIQTKLQGISEAYEAPGKPAKKRPPFAWG